MNSKHDIRILTERFFNGETTIEEEKALYRLYQGDDVPQDLLAYREMMLDMAAIGGEENHGAENHGDRSRDIADNHGDMSRDIADPSANHGPVPVIVLRWLIAAVIALAVVWGGITLFKSDSEEECVAYFYGHRVTDQAAVMNELSQTAMSMAHSRGDNDVAQQLDEMFN